MATGQILSTGVIPAGAIGNTQISNQTPDIINVDKLQPVFIGQTDFGFGIGDTPTTKEKIVYIGKVGGVIRGFHALLNAVGSATSIVFDLKKNGTSILSGTITITNTSTSMLKYDGTLASNTFVAGDVFSALMTESTNTGAQGPCAWAVFVENTAPTS